MKKILYTILFISLVPFLSFGQGLHYGEGSLKDGFTLESGGNITMPDDGWIGLSSTTARMVFDDQTTDEINFMSCNVGIGTNSPTHKFQVESTSDDLVSLKTTKNSGTLTPFKFYAGRPYTNAVDGDEVRIMRIFQSSDAALNAIETRLVAGVYDATSATRGSYLAYRITVNATVAEKMRIDPNGIGIGTTIPAEEVHIEGQIMSIADVIDNITTLTADSTHCMGAILTNTGDGDGSVINLPAAVKGFKITVVLTVAQDIDINPDDSDQILVLTNAAGDAISSDATAGSYITLVAVSTTNWIAISAAGTWTDVD